MTIAAIGALAGAALQAVGSVETTHAARPLNQAQTTMVLSPSKDNTLYEDASGSLSNGRGQHFFVGKTGATTNRIRRGVIAFDVAGGIPAGSTIDSVTLTLHMSRTQAGAQTVSVRRLLGDWGEGSSDAPSNEGGGTTASSGDATWTHSFFVTASWNAPGGDFQGSTRASASVGGVEFYSWSSAGLVSDVQGWLDDPSSNSGWLLQGNESQDQTTKRFDSRQNPVAANRPTLTVQYTPPPPTPTPTATATPTPDPNATPHSHRNLRGGGHAGTRPGRNRLASAANIPRRDRAVGARRHIGGPAGGTTKDLSGKPESTEGHRWTA